MERKKYFIAIVLLVLSITKMLASYKSEIYKAFISNNMNLWKKTIDEMNQQKNISNNFRIELLNYQYGYIGWCLGNDKNDMAEAYIELGELNIKIFEQNNYNVSLINSYKSAFYGFRIGLNLLKAPFIGPQSVECAKLAIKQDPSNPYGYIQYANSQYYMPAIFGGSKTLALKFYKMAEILMEKHPEQIKEDWNYLSLLTIIVKAYTETNDLKNAKIYCEKILKIEPEFLWVKNELYPNLLKN